MARLTNDREELIRLRRNTLAIGTTAIALLTLRDGSTIEGALRRVSAGSAVHEGRMHWHGGVEIQPLLSDHHVDVDLLDVELVQSVWDLRKEAYAEAGHIVIVDFPYPEGDS